MMDFADRQQHWISTTCEKSSNRGRASKMAALELTPQENLRLLQEIEANRRFILLIYQSDPELLSRADPEIKRLFRTDDQAALPTTRGWASTSA